LEKIKQLPFVVLLGLVALGLLYFFSFYGDRKAPPAKTHLPDSALLKTSEVSEVQEVSPSLASPVAPPEGPEAKEFKAQLKELFEKLPRKGFADREDVHSTPQALLQAAIEVGKVSDRYHQSTILKPEAFSFYLKCANSEDVIPQIRAVCFERARALSLELEGKKLKLQMPKEVLDLVER